MYAERHSPSIYEDQNNLFLDILDEAPLFDNRRPTSLIGSVFYCFLVASNTTSMPYANSRHFSAISGIPSAENTLAGLLCFQPEAEAYYSLTLCNICIWN